MGEYSETFGNLSIYQYQADGWAAGTYNTFIKYSVEILAVKYHFHETRKHNKENPDDGIYSLINGQDIIGQCSLYKDLLNDVTYLKIKMETKMKKGIKYNFDICFVSDILKKTVEVVHKKIESIYFDLQFEAMASGKKFNIPLPDYTGENITEDCTENNTSITIETKYGNRDETIELIKKDTSLLIELLTELNSPGFLKQLANEGYVYYDIKNNQAKVINNLNDTAAALKRITNNNVSYDQLKAYFLTPEGLSYSDSSYNKGIRQIKR
jgi:hypothetical protein